MKTTRFMHGTAFATAMATMLWSNLARAEDPVAAGQSGAAASQANWPGVVLPPAKDVELSGQVGEALARAIARMGNPPGKPHYNLPYVRADVSFEIKRTFTDWSGDLSGRFIELCSLISPPGQIYPPVLEPLMQTITQYQKEDGHYGVDVDLKQPIKSFSPLVKVLWGNARLMIGLVTGAERFGDQRLMDSARRLGNWYVNTADLLCNPNREAEYRRSGSYAGYQLGYFPAIESLAVLYRATKDERYLKQAERMAEFFVKFDCLPVGHSHGNLCAWRGILDLYGITGKHEYLDRAVAKWNAAVQGGYVWPLGGIGEHWDVMFKIDEGCSESDWLRFNLDLWRFTGQTRYLDMAERLLQNQYAANQNRGTGGFGNNSYEGEEGVGPHTIVGQAGEGGLCCSPHCTLGLFFLKGYLVAGSPQGIYINFPYSFRAPVKAAERDWKVSVTSSAAFLQGHTRMEIELAPQGESVNHRCALWVRLPGWATTAKAADASGNKVSARVEGGYLRIDREFKAGDKLTVDFENALSLEGRRFKKPANAVTTESRSIVRDVALLAGPDALFAMGIWTPGRPVLLATRDAQGNLSFPTKGEGQFVTVVLPSTDVTDAQIAEAIRSGQRTVLRPWSGIMASWKKPLTIKLAAAPVPEPGAKPPRPRLPFMFDLVVVPAASLKTDAASLAARGGNAEHH